MAPPLQRGLRRVTVGAQLGTRAYTPRIIRPRMLAPAFLLLAALSHYPAWADDSLAKDAVARHGQASESQADKGPLEGKNFSPHYLIFFNLPGLSARAPAGARYALGVSAYLSQEFLAAYKEPEDEIPTRYSDFENLSLEANARWYPSPRLQLGAAMRLIAYWGGLLDRPVEAFHELFGFPNAGREFHPAGEVSVDYSSTEGYHFLLNQSSISFGDIDLWIAATLVDNPGFAAALFGGAKLPSGSFSALSGSGGTDLAFAALLDLRLHTRVSLYLNAGLTLALSEPEANPGSARSFAQAIVALEYAISHRLSALLQANLKNPSMHSDIITINNLGQIGDQLGFPQTNLKFGIRRRSGKYLLQVYMEEDALTNNGVDFTLNIGLTRFFSR